MKEETGQNFSNTENSTNQTFQAKSLNDNLDHEINCDCGADHEHSHDHGHSHNHDHGHKHDHEHNHNHESCGCGEIHDHPHAAYCDTCGESLAYCTCEMPDEDVEKRVYILENLDCANCGAKIERKLKSLPAVQNCSVTFTTKQLRLAAPNQDEMFPEIEEICQSIEPDIKLIPRETSPGSVKTETFSIEGLDCANCAAKIERKIRSLPGVSNATITYATGLLKVTAKKSC